MQLTASLHVTPHIVTAPRRYTLCWTGEQSAWEGLSRGRCSLSPVKIKTVWLKSFLSDTQTSSGELWHHKKANEVDMPYPAQHVGCDFVPEEAPRWCRTNARAWAPGRWRTRASCWAPVERSREFLDSTARWSTGRFSRDPPEPAPCSPPAERTRVTWSFYTFIPNGSQIRAIEGSGPCSRGPNSSGGTREISKAQ